MTDQERLERLEAVDAIKRALLPDLTEENRTRLIQWARENEESLQA